MIDYHMSQFQFPYLWCSIRLHLERDRYHTLVFPMFYCEDSLEMNRRFKLRNFDCLQNMNESGFRVCVKELYETRYDPVSVAYAVLTGQ